MVKVLKAVSNLDITVKISMVIIPMLIMTSILPRTRVDHSFNLTPLSLADSRLMVL